MTVVTSGASVTGTATTSSRSWERQESGATIKARPREMSCRSCVWLCTSGPGPAG